MKPLKFVALILLATIFFLLDDKTVPPSDGENCGVSRANASQLSSPISNWQDYYDPDFKIAFQYPMEWEVKDSARNFL
jgi:spermidine/putrescine-binding protein